MHKRLKILITKGNNMRHQSLLIFGIFVFIVLVAAGCTSAPKECKTDKDCKNYQFCNTEKKLCEPRENSCEKNDDCKDELKECNTKTNACVFKAGRCRVDVNCDKWQICAPDNTCVTGPEFCDR